MEVVSPYEVRCPKCNVSFPVETKRCIHCGGHTGPSVVRLPNQPPTAHESYGMRSDSMAVPAHEPARGPQPFDFDEEDAEESQGGSGVLRGLITVMWVVLAIGFSIMRGCSDGGAALP